MDLGELLRPDGEGRKQFRHFFQGNPPRRGRILEILLGGMVQLFTGAEKRPCGAERTGNPLFHHTSIRAIIRFRCKVPKTYPFCKKQNG